jgi:hypothetical protein
MSDTETETQTQDDAVDIEPIIRKIVQEETASTNEKLSKIEESLGPLGELGDTLEGLFKKHKPSSTKIDEDGLVNKITESILGSVNEGSEGGNGNGSESTGHRKPGPLSRFLGIK